MKRILIFVITVVSLLLCFTLVASAEDEIHTGTLDNLTWEFNQTKGTLVISGSGEMSAVGGGAAWRKYNDMILSVELEDGVTSVSAYAFWSFSNLTTVKLPDGITFIGENAFSRCYKLKSIRLPSSVVSIEENAFEYCYSLSEVYIDTLEHWLTLNVDTSSPLLDSKYRLYMGETPVSEFTIPASVTELRPYAFCNCINCLPFVANITINNFSHSKEQKEK